MRRQLGKRRRALTIPEAVNWLAPEFMRMEPFGTAADVYSLACVLWEIVAREVPFQELADMLEAGQKEQDEADAAARQARNAELRAELKLKREAEAKAAAESTAKAAVTATAATEADPVSDAAAADAAALARLMATPFSGSALPPLPPHPDAGVAATAGTPKATTTSAGVDAKRSPALVQRHIVIDVAPEPDEKLAGAAATAATAAAGGQGPASLAAQEVVRLVSTTPASVRRVLSLATNPGAADAGPGAVAGLSQVDVILAGFAMDLQAQAQAQTQGQLQSQAQGTVAARPPLGRRGSLHTHTNLGANPGPAALTPAQTAVALLPAYTATSASGVSASGARGGLPRTASMAGGLRRSGSTHAFTPALAPVPPAPGGASGAAVAATGASPAGRLLSRPAPAMLGLPPLRVHAAPHGAEAKPLALLEGKSLSPLADAAAAAAAAKPDPTPLTPITGSEASLPRVQSMPSRSRSSTGSRNSAVSGVRRNAVATPSEVAAASAQQRAQYTRALLSITSTAATNGTTMGSAVVRVPAQAQAQAQAQSQHQQSFTLHAPPAVLAPGDDDGTAPADGAAAGANGGWRSLKRTPTVPTGSFIGARAFEIPAHEPPPPTAKVVVTTGHRSAAPILLHTAITRRATSIATGTLSASNSASLASGAAPPSTPSKQQQQQQGSPAPSAEGSVAEPFSAANADADTSASADTDTGAGSPSSAPASARGPLPPPAAPPLPAPAGEIELAVQVIQAPGPAVASTAPAAAQHAHASNHGDGAAASPVSAPAVAAAPALAPQQRRTVVEVMRELIAYGHYRPPVPAGTHPVLAELIVQGWHPEPSLRPTALEMYRRLLALYEELNQEDEDSSYGSDDDGSEGSLQDGTHSFEVLSTIKP
jgi:hypothetical protein